MSDQNSSLTIRVGVDGAAQANAAIQGIGKTIKDAGAGADAAGKHIAGMAYFMRSGIDGIRAAAAGGGDRAIFYTIDEGVRGLLANGMKLSTLVPVFGIVGAAIAGIAAIWEPFISQENELKQQTIDLNEALKQLPNTLKEIQDAASSGLFGQGSADKLSQFLTGASSYKVQMPVDQALRQGRISQAQADASINSYDKTPEAGQQSLFMSQVSGSGAMVSVEANLAERAKMANEQLVKQGFLIDELDDKGKATGKYTPSAAGQALLEQMKLQKEMHLETLSGIDREREADKQKFDEQMDHIRIFEQIANAKLPGGQTEAQQKLLSAIPGMKADASTGYNNELAALQKKDYTEQLTKTETAYDELNKALNQIPETYDKIRKAAAAAAAEEQHHLELSNEVKEATIRLKLQGIQGDPSLSTNQKEEQSLPIVHQLQLQIADDIKGLQDLQKGLNQESNDYLEIQKKILALKGESQALDNQGKKEAVPQYDPHQVAIERQKALAESFNQLAHAYENWNDVMVSVARVGVNSINSGIQSAASNITQVIEGTKTWHKALQDIGRTLITEVLQGILTVIEKLLVELAIDTAIKVVTGFSGGGFVGFDSGGYTGNVHPSQVAGVVHGGEYVFSAPAVQRIGLPALDAMHSGSSTSGGSSGSSQSMTHKVVVVMDRQGLLNEYKKQDFAQITVAHVYNNKMKAGIKT